MIKMLHKKQSLFFIIVLVISFNLLIISGLAEEDIIEQEIDMIEIEVSENEILTGEKVILTVTGTVNGYGNWQPLEDAIIIINDDETDYLTDENGQVEIIFEQSGVYIIEAQKNVESEQDEEGYEEYNIITSLSIKIVVGELPVKDDEIIEEKPEIDEVVMGAEFWLEGRKENMSEWAAIGLALNGYNDFNDYYNTLLDEISQNEGDYRKITDLQRISMAIHFIDEDPLDVSGHNLIEKIYNHDNMLKQGINGPIFSLITLDSGDFTIPEGSKWNRDMLIDEILERQNPDGGFALAQGVSDVDITAMVVQALDKYKNREEVSIALDEAITFLSTVQRDDAGYNHMSGAPNSQSVSQVIMALCFMGIDIENDERFIKNDKDLLDNLYMYLADDGGFKNILTQEHSDLMATEQAFLALVSYKNFLQGNPGTIYYKEYIYEEGEDTQDFIGYEGDEYVSNPDNNINDEEETTDSITEEEKEGNEQSEEVSKGIEEDKQKVNFLDILDISDWAVEYVQKASNLDLVKGYSNKFNPKGNITRAEFSAIITRILSDDEEKEYEEVFEDVKKDSWYFSYVMKAYEKEIVKGTSDDTFNPDDFITRQEMAVMLSRLLELSLEVNEVHIIDLDSASDWAIEHIRAVFSGGIMVGSDGCFNPQDDVTREMAAVITVRAYERLIR